MCRAVQAVQVAKGQKKTANLFKIYCLMCHFDGWQYFKLLLLDCPTAKLDESVSKGLKSRLLAID